MDTIYDTTTIATTVATTVATAFRDDRRDDRRGSRNFLILGFAERLDFLCRKWAPHIAQTSWETPWTLSSRADPLVTTRKPDSARYLPKRPCKHQTHLAEGSDPSTRRLDRI